MNCHFRPNRLRVKKIEWKRQKKRKANHPPPWMYAYVDETASTPDTLQHSFYYDSRVYICVCAFFFLLPNATLNLFGQSEMVSRQKKKRKKGFWLTDHPAIYFLLSVFISVLELSAHLYFISLRGIHTTVWTYSIRTQSFSSFFGF